jgi:hypothetical protein
VVNCTSDEENCDEVSSLDGAEIDDPQDVQLKSLGEEFVKQEASDELIDEFVKLDNDEKKVLANEEEVKQLGREAEEVFDDVNMSGKEGTVADEDLPDEAFGGGTFSGEAGLEFPKSDVKMVDISSVQFAHIRGGSLVKVMKLSRGEFDQSDDPMPAKVTLRLTWTIAWEEVNKADMASGKFGQVSDYGVEVRNKELPRGNFTWNIAFVRTNRSIIKKKMKN